MVGGAIEWWVMMQYGGRCKCVVGYDAIWQVMQKRVVGYEQIYEKKIFK